MPDETSEYSELFSVGDEILFKSARDFYVKNIEYFQIIAGVIVLGVLPIVYSNRLKQKRIKIHKSN